MATQAERISKLDRSPAFRYGTEIDLESNSTHATVIRLAGKGKRLLELGCGPGHMSRVLTERGCAVTAIEIDPVAADCAAAFCEKVIVGDLDELDLGEELAGERFDVVIAADVLEHLKDPASVLRSIKNFLRPDGCVIASIPNVAHVSVRLALLQGRFPYAETGLLDRTHLRFFTRESVEQLFDQAGMLIGHLHRTQSIPADPTHFEVPYDPSAVSPDLVETLGRDPEASTYQFVVVGYPLPHAGLEEIRNRMQRLAEDLDAAKRENAGLQEQLESVQRTRQALEAAEKGAALLRERIVRQEQQISEVSSALDAAQKETAAVRELNRQQTERIEKLEATNKALFAREKDLREMLFEAHDELLRRDEEISATLATALSEPKAAPAAAPSPLRSQSPPGKFTQYQQLLRRIREAVPRAVPQGGDVLVISKGDDDLLRLAPCRGLHFPQSKDGGYAGYYPADDHAAIRHLEELRSRGAHFLLIPEPSFWWLKHYSGFAEHLNHGFQRVIDEPGVCVMFDLANQNTSRTPSTQGDVRRVEAREFGVNLSGHVTSEKGVGEGARATIRALRAAGIPIVLNNFIDPGSANLETEAATLSHQNPYSMNLLHMNADEIPAFFAEHGTGYFEDHFNIGYWAWELSHFPSKWISSFELLDELWVPSSFVLDAVSRSSPVPVIRVPHALPEALPLTRLGRSYFGLPENKYLFLFMFDFMSIMERKNPLGLIEAFRKTFKGGDKAALILKGLHSESAPRALKALQQAAAGLDVIFLDKLLSKTETNTLLNACDCYVSLHRSEGFGLTLAESMSLEKPVIATGYSGNMDFMNAANSFPVNYELVPLPKTYEPYEKGCVWAEPDLKHAAELMRSVYENREAAAERGRRARRHILQQLSPAAVAETVCERFARLSELRKLAVPPGFLEAARHASGRARGKAVYRELIRSVHNAVRASTPPGSIIAIINKGDHDLLRIDGRDVWHFPQQPDGTYAGYYPEDTDEAISDLEKLRERGARFLVIPQTAFWWLDHYSGFRSHLEHAHQVVWRDENCMICEFSEPRRGAVSRVRRRAKAGGGD